MFTYPSFCLLLFRSFRHGVVFLGAIAAAVAQEPARDSNTAIEKHRKGILFVEAPPGTEVTVEQQLPGLID